MYIVKAYDESPGPSSVPWGTPLLAPGRIHVASPSAALPASPILTVFRDDLLFVFCPLVYCETLYQRRELKFENTSVYQVFWT